MGGFKCISESSYELIRQLHRKKIISEETYQQVEDCITIDKLNQILKNSVNINKKETMDKVFLYIVNEMWENWDRKEGVKGNDSFFCKAQNGFIKWLIYNKEGVCFREDCQNDIFTDNQITSYVIPLSAESEEEVKEIELYPLITIKTKRSYGGKPIFIINPYIINKIKNET